MVSFNRIKSVVAVAIFTLVAIPMGLAAQEEPEYVEMTLGNPDAKVIVTEYASFTCPHCGTFHQNVFGRLKSEYIDTGKILFRLREIYFDRYGLWAGIVARCGGESKYFGIVDLLFDKQDSWSRQNSPAQVAARLRGIGLAAGLTDTQLDACLTDQANAEMLFAAYQEFADDDGITSTPTFIINGKLHSNMPYEDFAELLDNELSE
ncbi:MAG: DsbA family protein [Rhodobacteraceae bacterium]|nr:DsbA family protein [Paracoccaceae bacterium]